MEHLRSDREFVICPKRVYEIMHNKEMKRYRMIERRLTIKGYKKRKKNTEREKLRIIELLKIKK